MSAAVILTALDLLIQLSERAAAAGALVRAAHERGTPATPEELATLLAPLNQHIAELDASIARAKAEGR